MKNLKNLCRMKMKLVEDLPGEHWYVFACRDCHREQGPEFTVANWRTTNESEHIPRVVPQSCTSHRYESDVLASVFFAETGRQTGNRHAIAA
jgi:hypothetical protein